GDDRHADGSLHGLPRGGAPLGAALQVAAEFLGDAGEDGGDGGEFGVAGVAAEHSEVRRHVAGGILCRVVARHLYSGMFPCLFGGVATRLVRSALSALVTATRVAAGSMTPSSSPRSAARKGLATLYVYSLASRVRTSLTSSPASSAALISPRKRMLTAPCPPMTAISAVGHA